MSSINKKLESDVAELLIKKIKWLVVCRTKKDEGLGPPVARLAHDTSIPREAGGEASLHLLDKTKAATTTMMIIRRETIAHKQRFAHFTSATRISASSLRLSSSDLPVSHSVVGRRGEKMIATPTIQKTGKKKP